jgi:hypothetical protein
MFAPEWPPETLPAFAQAVERHGFDELWLADRRAARRRRRERRAHPRRGRAGRAGRPAPRGAALRLRSGSAVTLHGMTRYELLPTRNADGTVTMRLVVVGVAERLRRFFRRA